MWFRCDQDLLYSSIMRDLGEGVRARDNHGKSRQFSFLLLLAKTADGQANDLESSADLSSLIGITQNQADTIWRVCLSRNVLRRTQKGYSVLEWMCERGLFLKPQEKHEKNESKNIFL